MQLQKKLAKCHQNKKNVAEYLHKLQELFNMIGDVSEWDRVLKFWNSAQPVIQKGLWRENLNMETLSWNHTTTTTTTTTAMTVQQHHHYYHNSRIMTMTTTATTATTATTFGARTVRKGPDDVRCIILPLGEWFFFLNFFLY